MSRDASSRLTDLAGTRTRLITGGVVPMLLFLLIQGGLNYPRLADLTAALVGAVAAAAITPGALTSARVRLMPGWMSAALILTALCATVAGGSELQRDGNVEIAYFAAGAGGPAWRCRVLPTALGVDHQRHRGHRGRCGHGEPRWAEVASGCAGWIPDGTPWNRHCRRCCPTSSRWLPCSRCGSRSTG